MSDTTTNEEPIYIHNVDIPGVPKLLGFTKDALQSSMIAVSLGLSDWTIDHLMQTERIISPEFQLEVKGEKIASWLQVEFDKDTVIPPEENKLLEDNKFYLEKFDSPDDKHWTYRFRIPEELSLDD